MAFFLVGQPFEMVLVLGNVSIRIKAPIDTINEPKTQFLAALFEVLVGLFEFQLFKHDAVAAHFITVDIGLHGHNVRIVD